MKFFSQIYSSEVAGTDTRHKLIWIRCDTFQFISTALQNSYDCNKCDKQDVLLD